MARSSAGVSGRQGISCGSGADSKEGPSASIKDGQPSSGRPDDSPAKGPSGVGVLLPGDHGILQEEVVTALQRGRKEGGGQQSREPANHPDQTTEGP